MLTSYNHCINQKSLYTIIIKTMCYKKHIKDIVAEIFDELHQQVYEEYNLNLTYKLFLQGYSSAWIEYQFTDPMIPHTQISVDP